MLIWYRVTNMVDIFLETDRLDTLPCLITNDNARSCQSVDGYVLRRCIYCHDCCAGKWWMVKFYVVNMNEGRGTFIYKFISLESSDVEISQNNNHEVIWKYLLETPSNDIVLIQTVSLIGGIGNNTIDTAMVLNEHVSNSYYYLLKGVLKSKIVRCPLQRTK